MILPWGASAWSSKHIVDMLCPPLEESGNPVVCYPVAGYPLGVKASWEPVQEGSGTPYPAGGGKNQLNPAEYEAATKTINGINFTRLNTGEVVVSGTATGTAIYVLIKSFSYSISLSTKNNWSIVGENVISAQGLVSGVTVLRQSDNTSLYIRVASGTTVKTTVQPQIEKGNTPTAWAPYENIRPIKGRDSVTVERCGENLLPFGERLEDIYRQQIMSSDALLLLSKACAGKKLTLTFSIETQNIVFNDDVESEWRKRIGFECHGTLADGTEVYTLQCWFYDASDEIPKNGKKTKTVTVTMPELASGAIIFYAQNIESGSFVAYDFGIYVGTTAPTTYTPYNGSTNTLTLPETVYGGEVDAVTGEGKKTRKLVTLDGNSAVTTYRENDDTDTYKGFAVSDAVEAISSSSSAICSHFNGGLASSQGYYPNTFLAHENGTLYIRTEIPGITSVETFKAYLAAQYAAGTPVQVGYKLAEPVPFTATGAQALPALAGVNTVLTDADSATVTGRADPIKRIEDLEAAVASIN